MKIDFKLRRRVIMRPIATTRAQERALSSIYKSIPQIWVDGSQRIIDAYSRTRITTDDVTDINYDISSTDQSSVSAVLNFKTLFTDWLLGFSRWHMQRMNANLKYVTNVDLTSVIGPDGDTLGAIIARNVALVQNVSDQTKQKIQDIVYRGLTNKTSVDQVAREIRDATGFARDRATRIASDQLVKASAALDQSRMQDLGIDSFQWQHSGKLHFRPWHKARDGQVFKWDDPEIANDKPGYAPFCGCKARGVIDGQ